jgi:hypothetical protein
MWWNLFFLLFFKLAAVMIITGANAEKVAMAYQHKEAELSRSLAQKYGEPLELPGVSVATQVAAMKTLSKLEPAALAQYSTPGMLSGSSHEPCAICHGP